MRMHAHNNDTWVQEKEEVYKVKKLYCWILCAALLFSLLPGRVFAVSQIELEAATPEEVIAAIAQVNAAADGSVFQLRLQGNITVKQDITLEKNTLTLLGGGYHLSVQGILLSGSAVLNLGQTDGSDTLQISSNDNTKAIAELNNSSRLNMYAGVTLGPSTAGGQAGGVQVHETSVFSMYGGTIRDCHNWASVSGGVWLNGHAAFHMYDGLIENCSGYTGGAVGISGAAPVTSASDSEQIKAKFHMHGGIIRNCYDKDTGGGAVCLFTQYPVEFIMDDGYITGCGSMDGQGYGGAIFVSDGNAILNGGAISQNEGNYGGGIFVYGGKAVIADNVKIFDNTAAEAGDDIYNNGASVTLGKAAAGATLSSCQDKIDGWYDDGDSRWDAHGEAPHMELFTHVGEEYTEEYALKAAHGLLNHSVYYHTGLETWKDTSEAYVYDETINGYIQSVPQGETAAEPQPPERTGHRFAGWHLEPEGKHLYDFSSVVEEDVHLYPKWIRNVEPGPDITDYFTLTYDSQGGTPYAAERYAKGATVALEKQPQKEGFVFTGWYADAACTQLISDVFMDRDRTVYAGWKGSGGVPEQLNGDDHFAYIIGYEDGLVHPDQNLTRAEVATIFFRLLKEKIRDQYQTKTNPFSDVTEEDWFNTAVSTMAALDVVRGYPDGRFAPQGVITRAEFAAMAARFDGQYTDKGKYFTDTVGHWAEQEIDRAAELGWVKGYADGSFQPERPITRAEAMALINRILRRNPEHRGDLLEDMRRWADNMDTERWYYLDVQEATNSHSYRRREDTYEFWTALLTSPNWGIL